MANETPQKEEVAEETPAPVKSGGIGSDVAEKITQQSSLQLTTSRDNKRARMDEIRERERLYYNLGEKSIRNPFNETYPYMPGFIDHMRAKIDDDSNLIYVHNSESDLKRTQKINAAYDMESKSQSVGGMWDLKHRHAKFNALFAGVAIYHYYSESDPVYCSYLSVISHYDFHCEPGGGAILENHLFCGQDNIFRNQEDMKLNGSYNQSQVDKLIGEYSRSGHKDNDDYDHIRNTRPEALKQDPVTNNYVGQSVIKLVSWYTTYQGKRYYVLFNETTKIWVRCCLLTDLFPDNLWPYTAWHTNEDPDVFWSKAPADDGFAVAKIMNRLINQELYNREKSNYGETHYDAEMYPNVAALVDSRPDKHVPVDTKGGQRSLSSGIYRPTMQNLNGTLDLVTWLDQFTGKQVGYTSAAAGQSESDKKVGVFQGEVEQVDQLINVKNKSYRNCLSAIGLRFKQGLEHNLKKEMAVKLLGPKGIEWEVLSPEDMKLDKDLTIQPVGGTSEMQLKRAKDTDKLDSLVTLQAVNPQWKERQILLLKGFTEDEIKDAFSPDSFAKRDLMSEAAQAEKDILEGKDPLMNRAADTNFIQHIIDFASDMFPEATAAMKEKMNAEEKKQYAAEEVMYVKLMDYAMAHIDIAVQNEARNVRDLIRQKRMAALGQSENPAPPVPGASSIEAPAPGAPVMPGSQVAQPGAPVASA